MDPGRDKVILRTFERRLKGRYAARANGAGWPEGAT